MASLFKPEIGTVGGTNVSVYSPPEMDYRGLFGTVSNIAATIEDAGKPPNISESDKKATALQTISAGKDRIFQIENRVKKEATWRMYKQQSFDAYPQYVDDIQKYFDKVEGYEYSDTGGKTIEDIKTATVFNWAETTEEGKMSFADNYYKNNGDPDRVRAGVEVDYYNSLAKKRQLQTTKEDVENLKLSKEAAGINIRPVIQAGIDKNVQAALSQFEVVAKDAVNKGLDPNVTVLDAAAQTRLMLVGMIQREYNEAGLAPTEADMNSYLGTFDAGIKYYETTKDYWQRSTLNQNLEAQARALTAAGVDPNLAIAIQKGDPAFNAMLANQASTAESLKKMQDYFKTIGQKPLSINGPLNNPEVVGTPAPNMTPTDSPSELSSMYSTVYDPQQMTEIQSSSVQQLQSVRALGMQAVRSLNRQNLQPEDIQYANKTVGAMFASLVPQIDKTGESLKPENVSQFMGNSVLDTIDAVYAKDKVSGGVLFNQVNQYATTGAVKLMSNFDAQMRVLSSNRPAPFVLKMDDRNNLTFEINKSVMKTDPYLARAMGAFRYETVGRGGTKAIPLPEPAETDPYKVLNNYLNLSGSAVTEGAERLFYVGGGTANEIKKMVESLQILVRQTDRLPDEIKKNIDAIELVRQQYGKEKAK
jgi:hypothetical protein